MSSTSSAISSNTEKVEKPPNWSRGKKRDREMTDKIVERALSSLGRGFDLTSDFRLKFCKGKERLVLLNESETRELTIPGFGSLQDVSVDIKCDKGDRTRYQSDILEFHKMSELFNQRSSILGKIPLGLFNAMFEFNGGSWAADAANTKYLGLDGYYISLFNVHIDRYPLILSDDVRNAVPHFWDPAALARFIQKYGTHIIVGLSIGGQDVLLVKQDKSSNLEPSELKKHFNDMGDQLFTGTCIFSRMHRKIKENRKAPPKAFQEFELEQPTSFKTFSNVTSKDGITLISSKRGGTSTISHCEWLLTVPYRQDAIDFSFIPITSLLKGVQGKGFLSHAINLYLRYKPQINELEYFLDFQSHRMWAPIHNDLRLGPTTNMSTTMVANPSLDFNFMGPKIYVNPNQVIVGKRPVTGMRLFLEGMKCNRLAIHLQHLSSTPMMLLNKIQDSRPLLWTSSVEAQDRQFFEPIQGKKFSHVCTKPVIYNPSSLRTTSTSTHPKYEVAFIVTGAQLLVREHQNTKKVLHLRLHFSKVNDFCIVQSIWAHGSNGLSQKSGFFSAIPAPMARGGGELEKEKNEAVVLDSGLFPGGPPVGHSQKKLMKFVDIREVCRGAQDNPGHWLVTGAKLELEKGKINLHVKFSLLNTNLSSSVEREDIDDVVSSSCIKI